MWESVEAINFVKVNKLTDVEERPGLYKIVNKNEPDKIYIGNAFTSLTSALTHNVFKCPGREATNDLLKEINKLKKENKDPEDYFDIYVCYQEAGGERFDLILAKRLNDSLFLNCSHIIITRVNRLNQSLSQKSFIFLMIIFRN